MREKEISISDEVFTIRDKMGICAVKRQQRKTDTHQNKESIFSPIWVVRNVRRAALTSPVAINR